MREALVRLEHGDGGVATLVLDRPPVNAIDLALLNRAAEVLAEIEAAKEIRALVVAGAGPCFSAGLDLKIVPTYSAGEQQRTVEGINGLVSRLYALPIPTVAAVHGHAIAGGLVLALACDYRVGVDGPCKIGLTEARAGIPFPAAAMTVVHAELGPAVARRLVLLARNYGAADALGDAILDELQAPEAVRSRAAALAVEFGAIPSEAYARIKRQLRAPAIARNAAVVAGGDPLVDAWLSTETGPASAALLRER
jgi:enoyl-CoA hydratase